MKEQSKFNKLLLGIVYVLIFIVGLTLVIQGQRTIGYRYLAQMLVGMGMLLFLVYMYNRKYNI